MDLGKQKATVVKAGLYTKGDKTIPYIEFKTLSQESVTWWGNLKGSTPEKTQMALEMTIGAFVKAGFTGNDWADLEKPVEQVFDTTKLITIVVGTSQNGKTIVDKIYGVDKPMTANTSKLPKAAALFQKAKAELGVKSTKTEEILF